VKTQGIRDGFMPWSGLALGTAGYFLAHQLGSDSTLQDCTAGSPWIVAVAALLGLVVIAAGALGSWRVYAAHAEPPARRLLAAVGLLASVLFAIALILPFIAALLIPRCWA
jgi:uncharacterized membrane protein